MDEQQIPPSEHEREFLCDASIKSAPFSPECSLWFKNNIHTVWRGKEHFWTPGEADFDQGSGGLHGEKKILSVEPMKSTIANDARATCMVRIIRRIHIIYAGT